MSPSQITALGIDLGGSSIKWGLVCQDGSIFQDGSVELTSRAEDRVIDAIAGIVAEALAMEGNDVVGIGIGSPGLMDSTRTIVRTAPNFSGWIDVPLANRVCEQVGIDLPVLLENDANVLVYSESRWGAAIGMKHFVVLTLGTGVGGGVMVDGKLLRGCNGGAGELGHIPIDINGPVCKTQVKGNLESYCGIEGVMREAENVYSPDSPPSNPDELTRAADAGDERAVEVWRRVGHYLGAGVAAYINIFNPQAVLIGGGISGAGDHLLKPARQTAQSRCFAPNWEDCTFDRAMLRDKAGLLGSAAMAFDKAEVETTSGL
ncbi:MAG TPA: ROK family protein [Bacteroidetes bacterium]|nr:glucokinase [bacterium BMS3Bbin04]HDO64873.1 ROK family protein [Bacteroidota bacterium]HEX03998.1 ROK family protein [Bacteroidota bacterium]